jgi:integrase
MIQQATPGSMLHDGNGLYFNASGPGRGSWEWRYSRFGNEHWMGLGSYRDVSLAQARQAMLEKRKMLKEGRDPITERRTQWVKEREEDKKSKTFRATADEYIDLQVFHERWKWSEATAKRMRSWLGKYAYPTIGVLPVRIVDTDMILNILEPIWISKSVTARRVRNLIKDVLDFARVRKYRDGDNPAEAIETVMPKRRKGKQVKHQAGLDFHKIGNFMVRLRRQPGVGAMALEFLILTATRTIETIGARWSEIDFTNKVWTIPAERMKAGKKHSIPLTEAALAVLAKMRQVAEGEFVFPGLKANTHISTMTMSVLLRRMSLRGVITVHGFRSTFRDWAGEKTDYLAFLIEIALAHKTKAAQSAGIDPELDKVYRRDQMLDKRRPLMEDWAEFLSKPSDPHGVGETNEDAKDELADAAD